ncbi:hypothetical protein EDD85DRAFT_958406 [Armillaria nabsnona]|nr:hypothetical protein EDD85DRAFT_958406 [Armillaria nabsnona]
MKKYPDFEYDTDKDQFEGEDVPILDGDNASPEGPYQTSRMKVVTSLRAREIERPLHGLKLFGVRYSLFGFINLLNPLEENKNQLLGKWASCIALYLSVFVLGSHIREEYLHEQDESVSA